MFGFNTLLAEVELPAYAIVPANYSGTAETGPWASLANYNSVAILLGTGAWAGGTAAVTVVQATDVNGTSSKALTLSKPTLWTGLTTAAQLTSAAIVSSTFNLSAANTLYLFEVPARSLDIANGFNHISLNVASPGSNNDYYWAMYLFRQPRYAQSGAAQLPEVYV